MQVFTTHLSTSWESKANYSSKSSGMLEVEGIPTATGNKVWAPQVIREHILNDVYRPHTFEEVAQIVSPEVSAQLDPKKALRHLVLQPTKIKNVLRFRKQDQNGRVYRKQECITHRPKEQWIGVPVP